MTICEQCDIETPEPVILKTPACEPETLCDECCREAVFDLLLMDGSLFARVVNENPTTIEVMVQQ